MKIFSKILSGRTSNDKKKPGTAAMAMVPAQGRYRDGLLTTPHPVSMDDDDDHRLPEHLSALVPPTPPPPPPSLLSTANGSSRLVDLGTVFEVEYSSSTESAEILKWMRKNRRRHSDDCISSSAAIEFDVEPAPLERHHHHHHHYHHPGAVPKLINGGSNSEAAKGGKRQDIGAATIEEGQGQGHPLPAPSTGKALMQLPPQNGSSRKSRSITPKSPNKPQSLLPYRRKGSIVPDTACSHKQSPIQSIARFESPPSNLQGASHHPLPLYHSPPSQITASRHPSDPILENEPLNHENRSSPEAAIKNDTLCFCSNSSSSSSSSTAVAQLSPPTETAVGHASHNKQGAERSYPIKTLLPMHAASSQLSSHPVGHQLPQPSQPSKQHSLIRSSSTPKAPSHPLYPTPSNNAVTLSPSAHRQNLKQKASPLPVHSRSASTNSWPVNPVTQYPHKWTIGQKLGQGTFGTVYEGHNQEDGSFFAVKISSEEHNSLETQQEVAVLSRLSHKNIVRYLGSNIENKHLYIFLELVRMGSLKSILKKFKCHDEKIISAYTRQLLHGLEYLHSQNTIHRDIKCANILVDVNGQVKLADFGVAKVLDHSPAQSLKGTPAYMAPEVMKSKPGQKSYGFPADIWSLGCTVIEMADGKPPWSNLEGFGFIFKLNGGELPHIPEHLSADAKDFISNCLKLQPEKRWTASQLLQHPFVANAPESVMQPDLPFLPTLSRSPSSPSPHLGLKSRSTGARRAQALMV